MVLINVECQWCGFPATRWQMLNMTIQQESVDIWVCDVCASKWRRQ